MNSEDGDEHALDREDIQAIAQGDGARLERFYARHARKVHAIAWRMVNDVGAAEDITQETFMRVWKNAHRYDPDLAAPTTWVHRIASNLCIDRLRKRRELNMDEAPERRDESVTADPERALFRQEIALHVQNALMALPERQRLAITLTVYLNHSNAEAGEAMSISEQAVESLLARGRRAMREILSPHRHEFLSGAANE